MHVPDVLAGKTVHIPVRIVKGRVTFFYSKRGTMPTLQDGAVGELVLPEYAVLDETAKHAITEERQVQLFDKGERIRLGFNGNLIDRDYLKRTEEWDDALPVVAGLTRLVSVLLDKPLFLLLRGTKKAQLRGGACEIPALDREKAGSLNHAYTLVSERFQPSRRSHTGNVFRVVFYREPDKEGKERWRRLADLRDRHEAEYEREALLGTDVVGPHSAPPQPMSPGRDQPRLQF